MSNPRIVVVDVDQSSTGRVQTMAKSMGIPSRVFATAEELIEARAVDAAGVVVSEFRLLGINGIDMQQKLRRLNRNIQVVFHTAYAETWLTVLAMQNGAFTVLDKPAGEQQLWDAIRLAMNRYVTIRTSQQVFNQLRQGVHQLTTRQQEVLNLMVEGIPNKVIASQLDLSVRTVESYRHIIFERTRTGSLAELVRLVTLANVHDSYDVTG